MLKTDFERYSRFPTEFGRARPICHQLVEIYAGRAAPRGIGANRELSPSEFQH
ncbi:MAG TPA: hypothetical protein VK535_14505 [Gemmatimonadales bacterium]|nr:hypothetical protein [Gemmatimonadales bacterium]